MPSLNCCLMKVCDREVDSVPLRDILLLSSRGEWRRGGGGADVHSCREMEGERFAGEGFSVS